MREFGFMQMGLQDENIEKRTYTSVDLYKACLVARRFFIKSKDSEENFRLVARMTWIQVGISLKIRHTWKLWQLDVKIFSLFAEKLT